MESGRIVAQVGVSPRHTPNGNTKDSSKETFHLSYVFYCLPNKVDGFWGKSEGTPRQKTPIHG